DADTQQVSDEYLGSHLLRSHCPVTNQPDWGTLTIRYSGVAINRESLLRYIVSFRQHNGFHEQCVEQIYSDIMTQCHPDSLTVCAQYTRRGGIDINPLRSSDNRPLVLNRVWRQ
ncbi:MAG: NADPH-dependent 7-cyano-7-deazaguanine reductase QueF, partial [Pseudomonadales bacterium]